MAVEAVEGCVMQLLKIMVDYADCSDWKATVGSS